MTWDWDRDYDELMENAAKEDLVLKFSIGDKIFRGKKNSKTSEEGSELCSSSSFDHYQWMIARFNTFTFAIQWPNSPAP